MMTRIALAALTAALVAAAPAAALGHDWEDAFLLDSDTLAPDFDGEPALDPGDDVFLVDEEGALPDLDFDALLDPVTGSGDDGGDTTASGSGAETTPAGTSGDASPAPWYRSIGALGVIGILVLSLALAVVAWRRAN